MSAHLRAARVTRIRQAYGYKAVLVNLRTDPMLRNSGYLALSTATISLLGFMFWLLNARLFGASRIGEATSLISATSLIAVEDQADRTDAVFVEVIAVPKESGCGHARALFIAQLGG